MKITDTEGPYNLLDHGIFATKGGENVLPGAEHLWYKIDTQWGPLWVHSSDVKEKV